ncbi:MAG: hypothetical protein HYW07_01945 [Candidatus Latescibacteria bacterium]|nr:hypothetical protein [Candidatus Latescibacterota bacterium]
MAKLRFGIIGCGDIAAHSFAPSLLKSAQAELVAVCGCLCPALRRLRRAGRVLDPGGGGCRPAVGQGTVPRQGGAVGLRRGAGKGCQTNC